MSRFTETWHCTTYPAIDPHRPELCLKGRNIIITGGSSGIGARTALSFAAAGAANIAIFARRRDGLLKTEADVQKAFSDTRVHVFVTDVTVKEDVQNAFSEFTNQVGKPDVLINNAGFGREDGLIRDSEVDDWSNAIDVNLKGSFFVAQAFLRHAADSAVIINIASSISFPNVLPRYSSYAVSKAASVRLFDCIQAEHPKLRVMHLHPGRVQTAMTRPGVTNPDDVSLPADVMVWTCSPEAKFLKGKYVFANWDVDEMKAKAEEIAGSSLLSVNIGGWPFSE